MKFSIRIRRKKGKEAATETVARESTRTPAEAGVRTRFAPSPTGYMHVGGARTAIYAWLFALQHGGSFVLRIEDTDKEREVEGAIGHIMQSLKWLGIKWNESIDIGGPYGPYIQSERLEIYRRYAQGLLASGHAYSNPYTEEEVDTFRKKAEEEKRPFLYRNHRPASARGSAEKEAEKGSGTQNGGQEWDGTSPLRFRVPEIKRYEWNDLIMGDLSAGEEALDDFIIIKSDGYPTYNFAHVIDDIEMKITHVMRGQEFVSSTPKFLSLYDALGVQPPHFATLPPILGETGTKKLSKRDGAKDILDYREEGYLPETMINFLALLGWHPSEGLSAGGSDREVLSREDLLREFEIERVQKSGAQFDEQKLLHLNREWLRTLSDADYLERGEFSVPEGTADEQAREALLLKLVPLLKERAHTFGEARDMLSGELSSLFSAPKPSKEGLSAKAVSQTASSTKMHLEAILGLVEGLHEGEDAGSIKEKLMPYADGVSKEDGGRGAALWPLRYALSGAERSPDPFVLISLLGPEESASRIRTALGILGE